MKTKKLVVGALVFLTIIMLGLLMNVSKATVRTESIFVKIRRDRQETVAWAAENPDNPDEILDKEYTAKFSHQLKRTNATTKNIWKLYKVENSNGDPTNNPIPNLYCLRAGLGFHNPSGEVDSEDARPVEYTQAFDMVEDYNAIKKIFDDFGSKTEVDIFKSGNLKNFNSVMWILDNMLLEDASDEEVKQYLLDHAGYTEDELELGYAQFSGNVLSRSDIEAIQQLAIWYFTNSTDESYHPTNKNLPPIYLKIDNIEGAAALDKKDYLPYESIFQFYTLDGVPVNYGEDRQEAAEALFTYLINEASKNASNLDLYKPSSREITVYLTGGNTAAEQQPIVEVKEKSPKVDLALRKFISSVERNGKVTKLDGADSRAPEVDTSKLNKVNPETGLLNTTAIYNHTKKPYPVEKGDIVTYTLRIYNEWETDAYVQEVTDYLPKYLEYVDYKDGKAQVDWVKDDAIGRIVKSTEYCKVTGASEDIADTAIGSNLGKVKIPAAVYNPETEDYTLSYIDIEIQCKVVDASDIEPVPYETNITNIAQITKMTKFIDGKETPVTSKKDERDSVPDANFRYPEDIALPDYGDDNTGKNDYFPGQEDDDDYEKVIIKKPELDLALRKFIYAVDGEKLTGRDSREPRVVTTKLDSGESTTAEYIHPKGAIEVKKGSIVTYTIRVYNEGEVNGYVSQITDYLPGYLIYLKDNEINKKYKWTYNEATREIKTEITAKDRVQGGDPTSPYASRENGKLLTAYTGGGVLNYIDVQVVCRVDDKALGNGILTNLAQITGETTEDGKPVEADRDSKPNGDKRPNQEFWVPEGNQRPTYKDDISNNPYVPGQEDDDDFEKVKVKPDFDLALRKFITQVGNTQINNRYPSLSLENGQIKYTHPKDPLPVETNDVVIYTIRIYNEGEKAGYANEITDDIPEGLEFLPNHEINNKNGYGWRMLDKDQKETTDVSKAKYIVTDYLSQEKGKQNEIKAFDKAAGIKNGNPDYRDVKVAFKVTYLPKTIEDTKKVLVNVAQISADSDDDIDSVPKRDDVYNKDGKNEDDIDYDNVRVKYFDLALLKWVAKTQITLNGKTVVADTGHTAETAKNENPVKIELKPKDINKVVIKYTYYIQVTNEGEITGAATEIKDYIPKGLRFEAADNTEWGWTKISEDEVTTNYLKGKMLVPGASATVPIVLTWINGSENLGEKINLAEISVDYNKNDIPDIDSTPNNKAPEEDDIDDAPVIIAIKTGTAQTYIGLTMIILITIASGISLIKKYVLE